MDFSGRVAVVTGGASGIGAATAALLRAKGAVPIVWDIDQGADVVCDVSDPAAVLAGHAATVDQAGHPSLLVAAAGVGRRALLMEEDPQSWDRVFAVNVRGAMLCLQAVARSARELGLGGGAVLVSSINGVLADPGLAAYSASKAAVSHLARVAAIELGPENFSVNAVGPGPTATAMLASNLERPGYLEQVEENTPMGRIGTPGDVADGIVTLLASRWITGQVVQVDGGASLVTARGAARRAMVAD